MSSRTLCPASYTKRLKPSCINWESTDEFMRSHTKGGVEAKIEHMINEPICEFPFPKKVRHLLGTIQQARIDLVRIVTNTVLDMALSMLISHWRFPNLIFQVFIHSLPQGFMRFVEPGSNWINLSSDFITHIASCHSGCLEKTPRKSPTRSSDSILTLPKSMSFSNTNQQKCGRTDYL